jgi:hypothetical protein
LFIIAIEQKVLTRYPGVVSEEYIHALRNLRGIPKEFNPEMHLSKIRMKWNRFYDAHPTATRTQLLRHVAEIDREFGRYFRPIPSGVSS